MTNWKSHTPLIASLGDGGCTFFFTFVGHLQAQFLKMYQQCYQKWNSGPMEEDPPRRLDQKEFSSSLVKSLCGTFTNRRPTGLPSAVPLSLVHSPGHESVNLVKDGALKRGRCHQCSMGPNKKAWTETVFGCLRCKVRLCRDKCHYLYHASLAVNSS